MANVARKYLAADDVEALLTDWGRLNEMIMALPLPAVCQLMEAEVNGKRRPMYLVRLHGRYTRLMSAKERIALLEGKLPWHATLNPISQ